MVPAIDGISEGCFIFLPFSAAIFLATLGMIKI
jgi:hypothetical protein